MASKNKSALYYVSGIQLSRVRVAESQQSKQPGVSELISGRHARSAVYIVSHVRCMPSPVWVDVASIRNIYRRHCCSKTKHSAIPQERYGAEFTAFLIV